MRDSLRRKIRRLQGAALLCLLALAGCAQPISVPSGGPPTPIVLRTPPPTATPIPPAPIPSPAPTAPPSVYVALNDASLAALDISTGATRWHKTLALVSALTLVNNVLYIGTNVGVYALNALDGSTRWYLHQGDAPIVGLEVQNNIIYIVSEAGNIQALNASDGDVRWGESTGIELNSLTLDGDRLFASSQFGTLEAWDVNGTVLWSQQTNDVSYSRVVASNGMLYLAENLPDGNPALPHLLAFSRDGQPLWDITPGHGRTLAAPVVATDGSIYTADDQGIYAIDPLKGTPRWQVQMGFTMQSAQHALAIAGNLVIFCLIPPLSQELRGQVLAYSQGEGKPYWQAALEANGGVLDVNCQAMGNLLIVEAIGRLYALNSTNGDRLWENPLDNNAGPILALG